MVELLAPARDSTALKAALESGANAVYIGLDGYNLRSHAQNFSLEDLPPAVEACHLHDAKLYLSTNTIMNDTRIRSLKKILPDIAASGVDAIIASDLGVINIARKMDLDVHVSVQANISNLESLKLLHELGVKRVILSRELTLGEIKDMIDKSPIEVEVFIHGAMCLAISGRCFLSTYLYQKSANCGECLQPCRKEWKLICEDNDDDILSFGGNNPLKGYDNRFKENKFKNNRFKEFKDSGFKGYILSPKDLCMVEHIPELINAGISSFKIEGRARPADYVATVTSVYREAIDSYESGNWKFNNKWLDKLREVYNRGFDTGFYFQTPYKTSSYNQATHTKQDIGEVVNYYSKVKAAEIRLWQPLKVGEEIVVQGPTTGSFTQKVESLQIEHKNILETKKGQNVGISLENKVRPGDLVYKKIKRN